jgi:phosphoenolpyruvate-protein phosphotransferase (PTS system enzyme I)
VSRPLDPSQGDSVHWGAFPFSVYVDAEPLGVAPEGHCRAILSGIPGSPGLAMAQAYLHTANELWVDAHKIDETRIDAEIARFIDAIEAVKVDKRNLREEAEERIGKSEAQIFESHVLLLDDPEVITRTKNLIRSERRNAADAYYRTLQKAIEILTSPETPPHLAERATDIEDILAAVLSELTGQPGNSLDALDEDSLVVAHMLTPSDTARMRPERVRGFVTDGGGPTSHASILARSMGIPAIVGCKRASNVISPGEIVLIDGYSGTVYVGPDEDLRVEFLAWQERLHARAAELFDDISPTATTLDGHEIRVELNIELLAEARRAHLCPGDGIGLFRTEFLFLSRDDFPSEEEQFVAYRELAELFEGRNVIIRTMDVGGDKLSSQLHVTPEMNPFLGWRAIRIHLAQPDLFGQQLRAILRASAYGNISLMFPLVTSVDELIEAHEHVDIARRLLDERGQAYDSGMKIGVMIETPSAVMMADALAEHADFFSIGTNDLVQYTLAVDRNNERVASLFDVYHPGVLKLVRETIRAGHAAGIEVHVCGEMAHETLAAVLLVGLGIDCLSMAPGGVPEIKHLIRQFSLADARRIADEALAQTTGKDVRTVLRHALSEHGLLSLDSTQGIT